MINDRKHYCTLAANQSVGLPCYNPLHYWSKFYKGVKQGIQLACIRCPNAQFRKLLMNFDLKSKFMLSKTLFGWWRTLNTEYSAQGSNLRLMDIFKATTSMVIPCPILYKKLYPKSLLTASVHRSMLLSHKNKSTQILCLLPYLLRVFASVADQHISVLPKEGNSVYLQQTPSCIIT